MSLKTCVRVLPRLVNSIKRNSALPHCPTFVQFNHHHVSPLYLQNRNNLRCSSTESGTKKSEKNTTQVYYGLLTPQIRAVKLFSLSSSIVGIVAQPFLYREIAATGDIPIIIAAYSFIGFFTVVTPVLLHLITKKYITHLLYKPETDSYIARTINFFCFTKQTEFNVDQVKVPEVPGMFTTFCAKGKALFVDPRLFERPEHYAKIMGYDKPMNFKLSEKPPPDSNKQVMD